MLSNYHYFLTLSKTLNISQAAKELFISHQCLSRYLKNLEEECGTKLFERKPNFCLTDAGEILLESFRSIEQIELNLSQSLSELKKSNTGQIRLGITEGRLRIFFPDLLAKYQPLFPEVTIKTTSAPTSQLTKMLLDNNLDLVLGNSTGTFNPDLNYELVLEEDLYLVASDNLLKQYFPNRYPSCKKDFAQGVNLQEFQNAPFCISYDGFNSRVIINNHLQQLHTTINIVYEASQPDLLHIMTQHDFAFSFCLSMYLPNIIKLNRTEPLNNHLNVFPIKGLQTKNPIFIITRKGHYFPQYAQEMISLIASQCKEYGDVQP